MGCGQSPLRETARFSPHPDAVIAPCVAMALRKSVAGPTNPTVIRMPRRGGGCTRGGLMKISFVLSRNTQSFARTESCGVPKVQAKLIEIRGVPRRHACLA